MRKESTRVQYACVVDDLDNEFIDVIIIRTKKKLFHRNHE